MPPSAIRQKQISYPWQDGNQAELLIDGKEIFPAMLSAMARAEQSIALEMYLLESGQLLNQFIGAFIQAAARGVTVYLLLDDFGARGVRLSDLERLRAAGVQISFYNPLHYGKWRRNLLRNHRKVLVVDAQMAFIGGMGLTDKFIDQGNPHAIWHDVAVQIDGPVVADWLEVFFSNWKLWSSGDNSEDKPAFLPPAAQVSHVGDQRARVVSSRRFGAMAIQRGLIQQVRRAEDRVWLMTAYFVPSRRLRRVLRAAAQRGADVRLLLPGPFTDHPGVRYAGRRFYTALLQAGVRIFEYQPRFLHAKVYMCDDWVSIGSSNMDRWNLRWNLEGNQEIKDVAFAARVRALFEEDFTHSQECLLSRWQWRPWYYRLQEWFWGWVDLRLEALRARWRDRD
jgi:phosphatidylserine/phosphatidylglycerophosphate/cardiolipin synthase-like enzyme